MTISGAGVGGQEDLPYPLKTAPSTTRNGSNAVGRVEIRQLEANDAEEGSALRRAVTAANPVATGLSVWAPHVHDAGPRQ